jgi:hypothetical protein
VAESLNALVMEDNNPIKGWQKIGFGRANPND